MSVYTLHSGREMQQIRRGLRRRLAVAGIVLGATLLLSTIGFVILDDDPQPIGARTFEAAWDTLNLVSTVGSLPELSPAQRLWAIIVIVFGLGAVLYGFGTLQALLHGGDVLHLYQRRKMRQKIELLENHVILCGYGTVGRGVAYHTREMSPETALLVVDSSPERAAQADEEGFITILGDCTSEETLRSAGVDRAQGIVATLSKDADNVYLCLFARQIRAGIRIVSRCERSETRAILLKAGADRVIVPGEIASIQLSYLMLKPRVSNFIISGTLKGAYDIAELCVKDHPRMVGRTIRELDLPRVANALVITATTEAGDELFNPAPDRRLERGDVLIVVCQGGGLARLDASLDAGQSGGVA